MATNLPMTPQMEQIHGEINDNFRALSNGFQRLDKIKDSNRQSKQLEELTGRMRECKRLIKEFESEIKDEGTRNPPEVTKQLNDEKQSMVKELNSYVALRKTYMSTNKRVELFDTGAGASEPMAEDNARMASGEFTFLFRVYSPFHTQHTNCNALRLLHYLPEPLNVTLGVSVCTSRLIGLLH
ncbi:unnamed protein product [Linum tenue]|uniref:Plant SNARE 13 n=1 Tax=Linum tenue TaxID=586396 RepID=A0AAV0I6T2_9ROSI|nr:unnamed protein product [Linum tenue]